MNKKTNLNPMQKRGLLEIGAIALVVITTLGVLLVISESKHIIVGDIKTKLIYDFSKCSEEVNKIPTNKQFSLLILSLTYDFSFLTVEPLVTKN